MVIDFSSFYDLPKEINRAFEGFSRPLFYNQGVKSYPLLNISEDADNYYVDVKVPGVSLEDIELTLTDKNLIIKGERQASEGKHYRRERLVGSFQRMVAIGAPVDREKVSAKYVDGILNVTLPKAEAVRPKKIAIES